MGSKVYDDVFRTLVNDCSSLLIPYVNEMFHENYTGEEEIQFFPNEHFLDRQSGKTKEKITDTCFGIVGEELKKYHLECQSTKDNSMLIRMFEYDTQIALDRGELKENVLTVVFPNPGILYLRGKEEIPNALKVELKTPGGVLSYDVQVMKLQMYCLEEIFQKKLYLLIPFYIFTHEARFSEYEKSEKEMSFLMEELETIRLRLDDLCHKGEIDEFTKRTILDMSQRVIDKIVKKYKIVRRGVKNVMCGEVIEHEAKRILNRGRAEGLRKTINQIQRKLQKGKTIAQIADELEDEESNISYIVNIMEECGVENVDEIVEKLLVVGA